MKLSEENLNVLKGLGEAVLLQRAISRAKAASAKATARKQALRMGKKEFHGEKIATSRH